MAMSNWTLVTEFVLKGFSETPQFQVLFFILFLFLYIMAICGNSLIVVAISFSPGLHTPMYFFLVNLAMIDFFCACTILPKLLEILVVEKRTISYVGCITQLFFLSWFVVAELLLFSAMAYDRYVAICHPLHYSSMMSPRVCVVMVGVVWGISLLGPGANAILISQLNFCGSHVIDHFFCEIPPVLLLSCSSTYPNDVVTLLADIFYAMFDFLFTMMSYGFIISTIMKIRTAEGKRRAFSTCSSHLIVVTMYYSTVIYTYQTPGSSYSPQAGKVMSVLYSTVSPTLNPLIYTLRNKDVKTALKKVFTFLAEKL